MDGRPISQSNPLEKLYEERKDKYEAFADAVIENDGTVEKAAKEILEMIQK